MLMAVKSKFKKSLRLKTRAFLFEEVNGSSEVRIRLSVLVCKGIGSH